MSKKKSHSGKTGLVFEELEPRLLLSADPLAVATDASVAVVQEHVIGNNADQTPIDQAAVEQPSSSIRNELVIIDARAPNFQQLHNDLIRSQQQGRNVQVVILDAHRDGIEQINEALSSHNKLDAVHIVSHGDDGQLQLGATQLNKVTLRERTSDIAEWRQGFSENGDLLIYGCDLASSADGRLLVNALGYLTATDVAASDDLTGSQLLGGDWELEYEAGDVETEVAFSDDVKQNWQGTLEGQAPAGSDQQQATEEQQQQEQQAQVELELQQAAVNEEQQKAAEQNDETEQAVIKQEQRTEIVFIDESVTDFQAFVDDLQGKSDDATRFEIHTLDGRSDGVEYIEAVLAEYENVNAVHIYSHGDDAAVKLGSTWLNPNNLEAYYDSLMAWGNGLDADADILIYGCNLVETDEGKQFANELALLTGADVAASDDLTGHSGLGADWELEHSTGSIESRLTISDELKNSWEHVMTVSVDASSSGSTADQASVTVSHTTSGTNRLMMVGVSMEPGGDSVSSITYNGVNLTFVGAEEDSTGGARVEIWELVAPDTGTHDVVVNLTGTNHKGVTVGVMTFTGVNQSSPTLSFASDSGKSTTASTTVVSAADDLVFGVIAVNKGTTVTPGAGQTEYWDIGVSSINGGGSIEAGAAAVTTSWTIIDEEWSAAAVSIQADTNSAQATSLSSVQDSYIQLSNPTTNAGTSGSMVIDRETGDLQRALVQFDLGSIPPGSTIQSATLKLEATSVAGLLNVEAYQLLESWAEGSVTWNESSSGTNWSTAGGAYNATALDSIATDTAGQHSFDISTLAQEWLDGTSQNYGVLIGSPDGGGNRTITYDSREGAAVPVLEIVYTANSAPVNAVPVAQSTDEDTSLTFDTANGNPISITAGAGEVLTTTISVTQGSLNLSQTTGLTFDAGANGTATMTVTGTVEDINAALDGLQYLPSTDYNGADTLTLTSSNAEIYSLEIDSNLLGRYEFSAASPGDDSSPAGTNTATLVGNATIVTDGTRGDVVSLDGTAHAEIPGFFGEPVDATLAAWVNLTAYDSNGADIISLGDNLILRYEDWNHSLNGIYYDGTSWHQVNFQTGINLAGDGWHHVAYSVDDTNNTHAIYFDGVEVASSAMTGSVTYTFGTNSYIGAHGLLAPQWDLIGLVDDARIYDRALTAAEIATLANAPVRSSDSDSVAITVTPVNDAPVIASNGGGATVAINVAENTTAVTTVTATDVDLDTVTYSISGADSALFNIDPGTGVLTFISAPNFEAPADADTNNVYEVTVQASDGSATDTQAISVTVTEVLELAVTNTNATGTGSLHEAILNANANTGVTDTITFNIPGAGPHVINLTGALPTITDSVIIDGTTDLDYAGTPMIVLDGSAAGSVSGITLSANNSTIRGLVINNFAQNGILINGNGNTIAGNYVGIDATGLLDRGNGQDGVQINGDNNIIGGTVLADRNIISGNGDEGIDINAGASDTIIHGNYVGTNAAGTAAIPNGAGGIGNWGGILVGGDNTTVGGTNPGEGNLISGNNSWGLIVEGNNNIVQGNLIGTQADGTSALGNTGHGIVADDFGGGTNNLIGGTAAGAGNVIANNGLDGISATGSVDVTILGNTILNNTAAGIDLGDDDVTANDAGDVDTGANDLQNFPVIATAELVATNLTLSGTLATDGPNTQYRIEFYGNVAGSQDATNGEGSVYLGSTMVTTDGSGNATFSGVTFGGVGLSVGDYVTATATRVVNAAQIGVDDQAAYGATSEFADNFLINNLPVAVADSYTAVEGIPYTAELGLNDLLLNDNDIDGDTLTVNTTPVTGPSNGVLVLNSDGTFTYTPNDNFNGIDTFIYEVNDGKGGSAQATATITVLQREIRILLTTQSDVNSSKVPGIASWDSGEILGIGDPNLSFEPVGSDGSLLAYFDLEAFSASNDMTINSLHWVSNTITVGSANSVTLQRGDILFVSDNNEVMTSTNSLAINAGDVVVFRPDAADDYSSGTFIHLLDQPGTAKTTGITLVEKNVLVGDVTLQAGTFLFTQESVAEEGSIYHFTAADVGAGTTTGVVSTLISSVDLGISYNNFFGVMIVNEDLFLDGTMVPAGSIVTTLENGSDFVGDNNIFADEDEIIYLTVNTTTMGSGATSADATVLFDAGDIGLNNNQKKIRSFTIIEEISAATNVDPVITPSLTTISYNEGDPPTVIDAAIVLTDPDSADFDGGLLRVDLGTSGLPNDRLSIRDQGTAPGQIGVNGNDVTYGGIVIGSRAGGTNGSEPLTVIFNVDADVTAIQALLRNITYENTSNNPSENQRTINFAITDGDGGVSNTVTVNAVVNNVNFAPVLTGANDLNPIDEDLFNNGGTLVSILTSGWITDADAGSLEGIAVIGVDNTNGSWEFSIDGGTNWTAFGTPGATAARHLAADANTFVRYVPNPDWNGTVTNGITFHAWDQTSGTNGDVLNITAGGNIRDEFGTVSYSNNDGTASWTSDWVETTDSGSPNNGNVRIESGKLHLDSQGGGSGEAATRGFDLAGVSSAVLTFDYDGYGAGGLDTLAVEISSDGGSTWTLLENIDIIGNVSDSKSYTLDSYTTLTADMQLRFRVAQGFNNAGQEVNIDNVDIAYTGTGIGGSTAVSIASASSSITVNPVNDAPVMDLDADDSSSATGLDFQTNFVELNGAVSIVDGDVSLLDIDSANLASINVTLTNELDPGNKEALSANAGATSLTVSGVGTDVLTISGAGTVADYLSVLSTVTYDNTANNPDTTPRVITFVANDGTIDSLVATTTVTVTQTVKPPVNTVPGPQTIAEDTPTAISGIDVRDNDNNLTTVSLSVNNGTLNVTLQGGVTISAGANGSNSLTLSGGTETEINDTLATLVYQSDLNYTGADTLTVLSTDALANIDTDTVAITVTPVNDAPLATDDPGSFSAGILTLSPPGYWRFGEPSGTIAVDDGTTGVDATYNGVALGQAGAVAGDTDTSAGFDGIDDYIEIPHNDAYLIDEGTVQLWFNSNDLSTDQALFSKDSSDLDTGGHFTIRVLIDGSVEVRLQSTTGDNFMYSVAGLVTANNWHHVAVTFGSGGMELFVDGASAATNAYTGGLGPSSGGTGNFEPIAIGASTRTSGNLTVTPLQDFFSGRIDEVAIFDQALSADQIQDIHASALQNYTVAEDNTLVVAASEGVLINDSDIEGDALNAVLVSGPSNAAAFNLNADGSFSYTPVANFSGTDSFTYMANDGTDDSNVATVTITVTGDNDAPVNTAPVSVTVLEDTQTAIAGLSVSDADAGAAIITTQLTVTNGVLDVTLAGSATISAGTNGSNTLTISGNVTDINATLASLQYTGNLNLNGTAADTLTMVTNDLGNTGSGGAQSDTDNVQIDITAVNDAPVARDDRSGLMFDGGDDYVRIGDYAGLNVTTSVTMEAWIRPTGLGTGSQLIINKEGEYEVGITADTGEIKWAFDNGDPGWNWHNTGYFATANEWTHIAVTYDNGTVNTYANGVLVESYNGSGVIADAYPTMNDLTIGGRQNATDQRFDGQIDEVRVWNAARTQVDIQNNMNTLLTGAEAGLIGNWRFDEGSGTVVADRSLLGHHGTLADGVTAVEMPTWQGYVVDEDGTLTVNAANGVLPNDYDVDGDALTAVLVAGPANASAFTLNADGSFSYTPNVNFNGIDSFTYMANDGSDDSNVATVTIRVNPINDLPVATDNTVTTSEDTAFNFAATDFTFTDVEGDSLVAARISNLSLGGGTLTHSGGTPVAGGDTLTAAQLDTLVYTPPSDLSGTPLASFDFTVNDADLGTVTATMNINVTPVNDAPQATNLSAPETYTEDTPLNLTDIVVSDVDSANVTVTLTLSEPAAGSLNTGTSGSVTSTFVGGVWTANGAVADVNTLLAGLIFTPSLNYNSNFTIATSVDDGVAPAITGTKVMTGTAVNDAPQATNLSAPETYTEDTALNLTDIVISDLDSANVTVTLTLSDVAAGTLNTGTSGSVTSTFAGGVWTASGAIADVNTLLSGLTFTPSLNYNSNFSIATSVDDGIAPAITGTKAMTGTAVNDAPQATNLSAGETYTEDTPLNLTDIVVSDVDSANITVTLTLSDPAAGSLNTGTSGSVTSTFVGGTWTASGAIADVNNLLAGLTFTPATNYNSNFSIATSVDDGITPAITGTKVMTGTPVNDAPQATNLSAPETYTEDTALDLTDIVVSDVDSASITVTLTLSDPAAGSLNTGTSGSVTSTFVGGTWTASGAVTDVNNLLAGQTFTPASNYNSNFSIATSVDDGIAPAITGTKAMTGTPVNDAPQATNLSAAESYTENTPLDLTDIVVSDVDSTNVTVTLTLSDPAAGSLNTGTSGTVTSTYNAVSGTWQASGAIADVNALLSGLNFTPSLDYNSNFSIATSVDDGIAPAITGTKAMTGTAVNNPPAATNLSAPETYTEDTALNLTDIVVSDVDSANVTVTLSLSDPAAGSLNTGTSGSVTSTFVGGVWTASGAIADVNTLLSGLTFTPSLNYNSNFSIATSVDDGIAPAITGTKAMTGTAVNDAPQATNLSAPETYTEDTALNLTDIVVSDVDSANVTVTLSLSDPAAGSLNTGTSGSVTSTFVGGLWTASGAIADVNNLLAGLTFTPATNYNSNFTIATSVDDGVALAITGTKAMTGIAVNDTPQATNLSAPETYTEDTALNLTDIVVSDVDSANVTVTLSLSDPAAGSLNTGTSGSVTSTYVGGVWTASGAVADVNTLLAGLTFTPSLNYNSNFNIATSVDDGVAPAITGTKVMTGIAVNDVPVAIANTVTTIEDNAYNFSVVDFTYTDIESDGLVAARITNLSLVGGTLTYSGGIPVGDGDTLTAAQLNTLLYTPPADAHGTPLASFDFTVNDADLGVVTARMNINVTPVNDAPQATNLSAPETYTEDTALNLTDIVVSDVDSTNVTVTLTLSDVAAGSLNTGSSGSVTSTFAGGVWTASGAIADVNSLLAGLTFTPALNYNSNFSIATSVDDGIAPAITGIKAMTGIAVNDAPQATNLSAAETYVENTALNLTDIVVSDVDSANVTVTLTLSDVAAGSLNTGTSGSVTSTFAGGVWTASGAITDVNALLSGLNFTPSLDYNSNFSIATSVDDGIAPAITGTKMMTGTAVNNPPTATNLSTPETYTEDTALNLTDIVVSDVDSANVTVTLSLSDPAAGSLNTGTSGSVTSTFAGGVWTASGAIADVNTLLAGLTFTPSLNYNSNFSITTSVDDGIAPAITGTKAMTGTAVNDAPQATNLSAPETYTEDTALNLTDIVVSDVDSANVTVTLTLSDVAAGTINTGTSGSVTSTFVGGLWTASGAIADVNTLLAGLTFTPSLNYNSNFTIAISVDDGIAPAITGTKFMTGNAVNDAPVATANTVTTLEDTPFNFAATDFTYSDVESDALASVTFSNINPGGGSLTYSGGIAVSNGMTLTAAQLDTLVYTPAANANGTPLATFDFAVNDSGAGVAVAQMSINVTAQPDAAVIGGVDSGIVTEDLDPDLDNLLEVNGALTIIDPDAGEAVFNNGPNPGTYGVVTLNADGTWFYAANTNQAAIQALTTGQTLTDTITISSVDGTTHDITITIMGTNDVPVAGNDVANVNEGGSVIIDVAALVSDIDNAIDLNSIAITVLPANGTVVDNNNGTMTYTHNGSETLNDSFSYTISDISGAVSNTATIAISINPVNDPPIAGDDAAIVMEGGSVLIDLAANDIDVDSALNLNSISIIGAPANGSLVRNGDGTVTYTHDGSNTVSDSFTYTIEDVSGAISNTATVNIAITAVNDAPTTSGIADVTVNEDAANTTIDLNAAFDDTDNLDSELTYSIVGSTNTGLFALTGIDATSGQLTLDYAANMNGGAQISVRATDPSGQSVDTLFTVTVTPVNDAPVMQANTGMLANPTSPGAITTSELNVADIDNTTSEITYTITALPSNGALILNGVAMNVNDAFTQADIDNSRLVYQSAGTAATDQFGFVVSDNSGASLGSDTFNIIVQLAGDRDEEDSGIPPGNDDVDEQPEEEDSSETDTGGSSAVPGGLGGGYVPFGGSSAPQQPARVLTIDPGPGPETEQPPVKKENYVQTRMEYQQVTSFAGMQLKTMDALWSAIDKMKQEMADSAEEKMTTTEFRVAAAKSSGVVLTAGVVAWILRSGALLSSLISTIPLWKGYDPLPILAYKDDDKKKENEMHEDKIPTSLDELKKLKKLKSNKADEIDVDHIFSGSPLRE